MTKIMMQVSKKAAVLAGKEKWGCQIVEVALDSLTVQQRETLLSCEAGYDTAVSRAGCAFDLERTWPYGSVAAPEYAEATPETCRQAIDWIARRLAEIEAEKVAYTAERKADTERQVQLFMELGLMPEKSPGSGEVCTHYYTGSEWILSRDIQSLKDSRLDALKSEAQADCDRRNAEAKAARDAKTAAEVARTKSGEECLGAWVDQHGSELVRERKAGGFEWIGLAEQEWSKSQVESLGDLADEPEDHDGNPVFKDRTTPTLEEIARLKEIRSALSGKPATAKLTWVGYDVPQEDEYGSTSETKRVNQCEVCVTVTCPTGRDIDYYYGCASKVDA